jgi:hypothetical protein
MQLKTNTPSLREYQNALHSLGGFRGLARDSPYPIPPPRLSSLIDKPGR